MKSYTKSELARAAGVSRDTFRRWLKTDREFLRANNVQPKTKYLPPVVVKYLCEKYCIDI
jgi:DNA-binding XRE family transcriptional regulator